MISNRKHLAGTNGDGNIKMRPCAKQRENAPLPHIISDTSASRTLEYSQTHVRCRLVVWMSAIVLRCCPFLLPTYRIHSRPVLDPQLASRGLHTEETDSRLQRRQILHAARKSEAPGATKNLTDKPVTRARPRHPRERNRRRFRQKVETSPAALSSVGTATWKLSGAGEEKKVFENIFCAPS